ncbi:MAG: L-threonylcarbamoyladenylate synthase [Candidatus Magasanikbacteria bacterium]|nr:L-threonylcarbamoyladenylate synthase [Candidatus Magasanikbacteria bacterium]
MKIFTINQIDEIVVGLKEGQTAVFPTETSYGLGCDATNKQAVEKIYDIKERDFSKPLLVVVASVEMAKRYLVWNKTIDKLAKKYWPGALTIVAKCKNPQAFPQGVVSQVGMLAVRVSSNKIVKELSQKLNGPLVATSANLVGQKDVYDSEEIKNNFSNRISKPEMLLDLGKINYNKPSTVILIKENMWEVLRQGKLKINLTEKFSSAFFMSLFIIFSSFSAFFVILYAYMTGFYIDNISQAMLRVNAEKKHYVVGVKNPLVKVKGIYLTAYSAGSQNKMAEIIDLIKRTELNAIVIDIKDYSGLVLYDSQVPLVVSLKNKDNRLGDVKKLIEKLHKEKIYVIARQTVFQDPVLAEKKPQWAIKSKSGGLWRDKKGLSWVDPTKKEVWNYNLSIAKEAIALGFDEINFDYVRFPTDGNMSDTLYDDESKKKYEVMGEFFQFLNNKLSQEPVWISLDFFGLTMEQKGLNDMAIGQRIEDAVEFVDYICPMMYPSHYPYGHIGLTNPAENPRAVFENGMKLGTPKFEDKRTKVRPWIQAFNIGAVYDAEKIRAQIEVTEKYSNAGWLMWNASNRYSEAGLNKK